MTTSNPPLAMGHRVFIRFLFLFSAVVLFGAFLVVNLLLFNPAFRNLFLITKAGKSQKIVSDPLSVPGIFYGATIDWESGATPSSYAKNLTRSPVMYNFFIEIHDQVQLVTELKYIVDMVANSDASVLSLTVMPSRGFKVLNSASYDQMARIVSTINKLGVPVFLRYGHEMNGNWYAYGQQPVAYKESYIALTNSIRRYTKDTKMVWAPNSPAGYPDYGGLTDVSALKTSNRTEFNALDTNKDGVVNSLDDPFTPYYPGDEYVDWIGYSVFDFGDTKLPNKNKIPDPSYFLNNVNPTSAGSFNIYQMFAVRYSKPMAIMETSSTYFPNNVKQGDPSNYEIKQAWWNQVFSSNIRSTLPLIKIVAWFDLSKTEVDANGAPSLRDFSISQDRNMTTSLMKQLPSFVFFADSKI